MPIPLGVLAQAGAGAPQIVSNFDWIATVTASTAVASIQIGNLDDLSSYEFLTLYYSYQLSGSVSNQPRLHFTTDNNVHNRTLTRAFGTHEYVTDWNEQFEGVPLARNAAQISNNWYQGIGDLPDIRATNKRKSGYFLTYESLSGNALDFTAGISQQQSSAITTLEIESTSNIIAGSTFVLYGWRQT